MSETLAINSTISHYRIVSKLGAGGMGEVYLAEDTKLDRKVALKLLPAAFTQDEDRVRRFVQEAKAASALNHPNIITIYEIGEVDGTHFIATEFIEGQTLRQRMAGEKMMLPEALDIATQVASALAEAHSAGIVHRDIKPENVMVRPDGLVKVLDFGLAKLTESSPSPIDTEAPTAANVNTETGAIMGTPRYMSPEQARGQKADARTDLFSLGVMLYEMLSGRAPFAGETASHIIVAILEKEPMPLARAATGVPAELERIVTKAMVKDREERYQSAKELLIDLKRLKARQELEAEMARSASAEASVSATILTDGEARAETTAAQPNLPTDERIARTTSSAEYLVSEIKQHPRAALIASLLLIVSLAGLGYFYFVRSSGAISSLAILPFVNDSGNAEVEYLSDGMTETLIGSLSQLPNLNVKARSSVFRYKGKEFDLQKIAQELKVQAILTGRVVQRGEQLTLSLELVDVRTENAIWSERYDRQQADLVTLQSEIARDVLSKLKTKLSGAEEAKVARNYTAHPEAYRLYLKGRFHWDKRTKDDMLKAIECYKQAIAMDSTFALAYAGIALAYNSMGKNPDLSPKEAIPPAKAAALRALEIDPTLGAAQAALADSYAILDWNWAESERGFKRALELDPNASYAHAVHATSYLAPMKRTDEMLAEIKRSLELEPLSLISNTLLVTGYLYARENDKALEQARKAYDLAPDFQLARLWLGLAYIANGKYDDAIALGESGLQKSPANQHFLFFTGQAYAKAGRRREALQFIDRLRAAAKTQYVRTSWLACLYAALGDKDNAFAELERSFEEKDCFLPRASIDPAMDPLRGDPRFKEMMKRMNLPE